MRSARFDLPAFDFLTKDSTTRPRWQTVTVAKETALKSERIFRLWR